MTTQEHDKIYWAAFTKKGVIQIHEDGSFAHPAIFLRRKDAEWHGETQDVRKVRIVEVEAGKPDIAALTHKAMTEALKHLDIDETGSDLEKAVAEIRNAMEAIYARATARNVSGETWREDMRAEIEP